MSGRRKKPDGSRPEPTRALKAIMGKNEYKNSFGARSELETKGGRAVYFRLDALADQGIADMERLPFSIKILIESLLRSENGREVTRDDVMSLARYNPQAPAPLEIPFKPARVLLQDFTGVPCVVDLAAMRSAMARLGGDPQRINPRIPVDLVVDHSVQVDVASTPDALERNTTLEFGRNRERYELFRWAQEAFQNFRTIPPSTGICHQINLEYLAAVVQQRAMNGLPVVFPDTLVGTDSHTTMINGLGVAGWGVGGIEAEAVMLGEPLYMTAPPVVGFKLTGRLPEGVTATDLVLRVTEMLRAHGVVGKFVEFYGPGLSAMSVPDRATLANMAPEYGATMGYFPVDNQTLTYLRTTGRPEELVDLVERYCRTQGLLRSDDLPEPLFHETVELDMSTVMPCLAGPSRPQDRIEFSEMKEAWQRSLSAPTAGRGFNLPREAVEARTRVRLAGGTEAELAHGSVVIASITSCTNTSNPTVMLGAGLLAKKAVAKGLRKKPWVKTSLAPGSVAVTAYLKKTGLLDSLEALGFHVTGYGCATCIGNSGPLEEAVTRAIDDNGLVAACVVSGNRNFEGRINPHVRASYLASPPLVVAYALAGTVDTDLSSMPLGHTPDGDPVFLKDIWPSSTEVARLMEEALTSRLFTGVYHDIENANSQWNDIPVTKGELFSWKQKSTYIQEPPFFTGMAEDAVEASSIKNARVLVMAGNSITTDHISPAGSIRPDSPAGHYLVEHGVQPEDFNSYGSRRGNHDVMIRGTFANIRLRNMLAPGTEGGVTALLPSGEIMSIYEAAQRYEKGGVPVIVIAGRDYGMGSSRDWAAKGTALLGVRAVIAQSYERIHRSNLAGMGVLPLQFRPGESAQSLGLTGRELYSINVDAGLKAGQELSVSVTGEDGRTRHFNALCRLDMPVEVEYFRSGGMLQRVLRGFLK